MDPTKSDQMPGAITRRRVLGVAGLSVATAAVLAACGDDAQSGILPPAAPPTTRLPERSVNDAVLLHRPSLEHLIISVHEGVPAGRCRRVVRPHQDEPHPAGQGLEAATREWAASVHRGEPGIKANIVDPALPPSRTTETSPKTSPSCTG
jgi:hypothetical protein